MLVFALVSCTRGAEAAKYLGPTVVVASSDGARLFVANSDARQVAVVDLVSGKVINALKVPAEPTGLALNKDGSKLYVTCAAPKSTVCVIDARTMKISATLQAGHTAIGPALSADGKRLYVCNRFDNNVAVFDLAAGKEIAKVPMTREPFAAAVTPDGKSVFVINHLPIDRADAYDVAALVTVIDTATNQTTNIRLLNGSTSVRGLCVSPNGKYVYVAHVLARYQMPTTQLERGWMNTNALTIIDAASKKFVNSVLLDDVDLGAANPWGVACTADSQTICVAHAGTNEVSVINAAGVFEKLAKIAADEKAAATPGAKKEATGIYASATLADVPNDLAFLVDVRRRVSVDGVGPRGLIVVGSKAITAQYFSDSLAVVDVSTKAEKQVATIALGPKPELTVQRRGELLFNDARICFQHWQSCSTCHPDSRVDALNWDLMNDGLGTPKNNKSMLLAHKTPPAMWSAARANGEMGVRSGLTHILFAVRPEEEACAMDEYLKSLEPVPSPHLVNGQLSEAAKRGKEIFLNEEVGCGKCHPAPLYTDMLLHDVGTEGPYDRRDTFDTPSLVECWRTAPYMHEGHYLTIKEMFVKDAKHSKKHGNIEKLTDQQIDDLVEFVLSL
jgi:YVTN family beta-propeller protein